MEIGRHSLRRFLKKTMHNYSDLIRDKNAPAKAAPAETEAESKSLIGDAYDWVKNNVAKPLTNAAVMEPYNAVAGTVTAGGVKPVYLDVRPAPMMSKEWLAQTMSSGLGATLPYVIAGKVVKTPLGALGEKFGPGVMSAALKSNAAAQILGAGAYDFARVPFEGETRLGNAMGGAAAFGIFERGNRLSAGLKFADRISTRAITGVAGSAAYSFVSHGVSHGELPDSGKILESSVSGAVTNVFLPPTQRLLTRAWSHVTNKSEPHSEAHTEGPKPTEALAKPERELVRAQELKAREGYKDVVDYWRNPENRTKFIDGLKDYLRIPSVSTLPQHEPDMRIMANKIAADLGNIGMDNVKVIEGQAGEHPLVSAEYTGAGKDKPTMLLYAHYDVQPDSPAHEWTSPAFEPEIRDGRIYARGAADAKGHLFMLTKLVEGYFKTGNKPPINLKILFEGEEESAGGKGHIDRYVRQNAKSMSDVDGVLVLDTGMFAENLPTVNTGLRGIVTAKIDVRGPNHDLHSGEHGGAAPNPAQAISEIIASLKNRDGTVKIPGFYDQVQKPSKAELATWDRLPFDPIHYQQTELGVKGLIGDPNLTVLERLWAQPTIEVNGVSGGFAEAQGFKTIIPRDASANISLRLVPGMDPARTAQSFVDYIRKVAPDNVVTDVKIMSQSPAYSVDPAHPLIRAATDAFTKSFGVQAVTTREGASIPIAGVFSEALKVPVVLTGFTLPDSNLHAPNENMPVKNWHQGLEALGDYFEALGAIEKPVRKQ